MRAMKISTFEGADFLAVGLNDNSSRVLHEIMRIRRKHQMKKRFTKQEMKISAGWNGQQTISGYCPFKYVRQKSKE